jgi:glycosyltransferase involved in cell wall biosynthesis
MTGIQRVQAGVLLVALSDKKNNYAVDIVAYSDEKQSWQKIPSSLFIELCDVAQAMTEKDDSWHMILAKLSNLLISSPQYEFAAGCTLINLGTAWSLPNYLLAVRNLRKDRNLKYLQYVHDLIPLVIPDSCASDLPRQFSEWLTSAFASTDLFLVNSRNTSNDLLNAAKTLGVACPPVVLATLDVGPNAFEQTEGSLNIIRREGIHRFVLLVGTLEPRKNHIFAFNVWSQLKARRGDAGTPTLVCVGRKGWLFEPIFSRLEREPALARKVRILENVTDPELDTLYRQALFTFYPSRYEGWGMPITESLCYGKIPIVPNMGPFTEAGGAFAAYFEPGSEVSCLSVIEALLDSDESRIDLEKRVHTQFRPREWAHVWTDVKRSLDAIHQTASKAPDLPLGQMLFFARLEKGGIKPDLRTAEIYRAGNGWACPDRSGCHITGDGLLFHFSSARSRDRLLRLYLAVRGASTQATVVTLAGAKGCTVEQKIEPKSVGWLSVRLEPPPHGASAHTVRISVAPNTSVTALAVAAALDSDLAQRRKIIETALTPLISN